MTCDMVMRLAARLSPTLKELSLRSTTEDAVVCTSEGR